MAQARGYPGSEGRSLASHPTWRPHSEDDPADQVYLDKCQTRAFQLCGTFLHEVGHHVDRMDNRSQMRCPRGEPFAYAYERRLQEQLWPAYVAEFGESWLPSGARAESDLPEYGEA